MGKYCEKFKKGYLDMLLLQLLSEGDLYGYEMAQLFNTLSDNIITLTAGNMYPALYRLEDKGFISKRKELVGRRMEVVYYHLTELGEVELQEMRSDYQTVIDINERIFNYKVSREVAK